MALYHSGPRLLLLRPDLSPHHFHLNKYTLMSEEIFNQRCTQKGNRIDRFSRNTKGMEVPSVYVPVAYFEKPAPLSVTVWSAFNIQTPKCISISIPLTLTSVHSNPSHCLNTHIHKQIQK